MRGSSQGSFLGVLLMFNFLIGCHYIGMGVHFGIIQSAINRVCAFSDKSLHKIF